MQLKCEHTLWQRRHQSIIKTQMSTKYFQGFFICSPFCIYVGSSSDFSIHCLIPEGGAGNQNIKEEKWNTTWGPKRVPTSRKTISYNLHTLLYNYYILQNKAISTRNYIFLSNFYFFYLKKMNCVGTRAPGENPHRHVEGVITPHRQHMCSLS